MTTSTELGALDALLTGLDSGGREFEVLTKWFLENDPEYRARYSRVWLWDEWPDRWGRDRGIDLIAELREGGLAAVQAKNYGPAHSVTKRDVDSFLSESNRAVITERLLVATTDRVSGSATQVMVAQQKPVMTCMLDRLHRSRVSWPSDPLSPRARQSNPVQPRPHQIEALAAIDAWAKTDVDRGQLVMACGTGKSLVSIWAADQLKARRVLVLLPTIALLRQTALSWADEAGTSRRLLRICSDRSRLEEDLFDDGGLGTGGTTDPGVIATTLASSEKLLVLCTYDSSPTLAAAMEEVDGFAFDLVIADEAHRCAGLESSANKTVLDASAIPARRRLFVTATPTVYGVRDHGRLARRNVKAASMDDPAKFGRIIYRLSFAQAIERELLTPYQVAVIAIDDDEIHRLIQERRLVTADGDHAVEAAALATQLACARAMRNFGCKRLVAFHPLIRESKRFTEHFPTALKIMRESDRPAGEVWCAHVDGGGMTLAKRLATLRRFQATEPDDHRLLSNVRLLTEGVDIPGIDGVAFIDTHRGQTAIIQAVGRAVRLAPGKTVGTIVLPIIIRDGESVSAALARSEHRHVVDILTALRSHDPEISRSLDELRFSADDAVQTPPAIGRFVIDAPTAVGQEFADAVDVALTQALQVSTSRSRARVTNRRLQRVVREPIQPTAEQSFLIGLNELQQYRRRQLLAELPDNSRFPMREWWREAKDRWASGTLDDLAKATIANNLSWLADAFTPGEAWMRDAIARLSDADIAEQFASQLQIGGQHAHDEFSALREHHDSELGPFLGQLRRVQVLATHAAMSPVMQIHYLKAALRPAVHALATTASAPRPPAYYWLSRTEATLEGYVRECEKVARHEQPWGHTRSDLHPTLGDAWDAGAGAAQQLAPLLRRLSHYRYRDDEHDVAVRRVEEQALPPRRRFDALGWDIFLLVRAAGHRVDVATTQATVAGSRTARLAARDDLLVRAERRLADASEHPWKRRR